MSESNRHIPDALALLADADRAAKATRAEADRYARSRLAEADLLVQKARRVLAAAEAKASVMLATTRPPDVTEPDVVIDLDAVEAVAADPGPVAIPSELDRLIESAVGRAVNRAFSAGRGS